MHFEMLAIDVNIHITILHEAENLCAFTSSSFGLHQMKKNVYLNRFRLKNFCGSTLKTIAAKIVKI